MFCPSCGKEIPEQSAFCLHCGNRIAIAGTAPTAQTLTGTTRHGLSPASISGWREILGSREGWYRTGEMGPRIRQLYATLDPPYVPENEAIVFDAHIWDKRGHTPEFRLKEVAYRGKSVRDGWITATESRLVWLSAKDPYVFQVLYVAIQSVHRSGDYCKLILNDGLEVVMQLMAPGPSVVGLIAGFGASPSAQQQILNRADNKAQAAERFKADYTNFFKEIADENLRWRGGG